jgi:hypothetical protein
MKWHKGPPPSIGWWPASNARNLQCLRWWNGKYWSEPAFVGQSTQSAESAATLKATNQQPIEWTNRPIYWPERSKT